MHSKVSIAYCRLLRSKPLKLLFSQVLSFMARMATPMAPVTSWCEGTVIGFPHTFSKAATTPLLKAVPP